MTTHNPSYEPTNITTNDKGIVNSNHMTHSPSHEPTDIMTNNDANNTPQMTTDPTEISGLREERREFYKQRHRQKQQEGEVVVDCLLEQLADPQVRGDPLATLACLFTFKSLFQKSPKPGLLKRCCQQGLLPILMDVLDSSQSGPPHHTPQMWVQPLLYQVVMEILWVMSTVCLAYPQRYRSLCLLEPPLLTLLSSLTLLPGPFFQFSPLFSRTLNSLCRDLRFPAQSFSCVTLTQQMWDRVVWHQPWMSAYRDPRCVYLCSLTPHTTPPPTPPPTIASHLIHQGLAWPSLPQSSLPAQPTVADPLLPGGCPSADVWRGGGEGGVGERGGCDDIVFLSAMGDACFWAYMGAEALTRVTHISELLHSQWPSLKTVRPQIGDTVIVGEGEEVDMLTLTTGGGMLNVTTEGDMSNGVTERERSDMSNRATDKRKMAALMRGRVIDVREEEVTVFAVDYGMVVKVKTKCVYKLSGRATELAGIESQAKLCRLAGVQPPPVSESALELALCFLTNVTKSYSHTGPCLQQTGGLAAVCALVQVAPPAIRLQALRLMANMAAIPALTRHADCSPLLPPLLESLERGGGGMERRVWLCGVVATLQVIGNILHCKPGCRDLFFGLQGQVCVLRVMQKHRHGRQSHAILKAASCALRAAFSGLMKTSALAGEKSGESKEVGEDAEQEWTEGTPEKPRAAGKPRRASETLRAPEKPRRAPEKPRALEKPRAARKPRVSETQRVPEKPRAAETQWSQHTPPEEDRSLSTTPELWMEGADIDDNTDDDEEDSEEEKESSEEGRGTCHLQDRTPTRLMSRHYLKQEAQKLRAGQEGGKNWWGNAECSNRKNDDDDDDNNNDDNDDRGQEWTKASHLHHHLHHHHLITPNICRRQSDSSSGLADTWEDWHRLPTAATVASDLCAANDGSGRPVDGSYYELNSYVPFKEDGHHHFMDVDDLSCISLDLLTQLIIAMLNSEGGSIYLGVGRQGQVEGVCVGREERESVRMRVDEVMARCSPPIPHTLLQLTYLPVLTLSGDSAAVWRPCQDRFVVEIEVKRPGDRVLYSMTQGKEKVSWQRWGVLTLPLTEQDVREMVVKEEERSYLPALLDLQQRLHQCQQQVTSTRCTPPL